MRRFPIAVGLLLLSVSSATAARADDAPPSPPVPSSPDETSGTVRGSRILLAGAAGTAHFFDLSTYGLGGAMSLGGEGLRWGGAFNVQYLQARTVAGLTVNDEQLGGTADVKVTDWLRVGFGGGFEFLQVHRITNGDTLSGWGPMAVLTFAHDFDARPRSCFFLEADFKASFVGGDLAEVMSATLLAGVKLR